MDPRAGLIRRAMTSFNENVVLPSKAEGGVELSAGEIKAIQDYAKEHGRSWKADLSHDWMMASTGSPTLQGLRNKLGPTWLATYKLPKAEAMEGLGEEASELYNFIWNDQSTYNQLGNFVDNFDRKDAKGIYDSELAVKGMMYVADAAAEGYTKEFAPGSKARAMFSTACRLELAKYLVKDYEAGKLHSRFSKVDQSLPTESEETNQYCSGCGRVVSGDVAPEHNDDAERSTNPGRRCPGSGKKSVVSTAEAGGEHGFYVMGQHTSVAFFKTRAEAEAEAKRMNQSGGTNYTVEPAGPLSNADKAKKEAKVKTSHPWEYSVTVAIEDGDDADAMLAKVKGDPSINGRESFLSDDKKTLYVHVFSMANISNADEAKDYVVKLLDLFEGKVSVNKNETDEEVRALQKKLDVLKKNGQDGSEEYMRVLYALRDATAARNKSLGIKVQNLRKEAVNIDMGPGHKGLYAKWSELSKEDKEDAKKVYSYDLKDTPWLTHEVFMYPVDDEGKLRHGNRYITHEDADKAKENYEQSDAPEENPTEVPTPDPMEPEADAPDAAPSKFPFDANELPHTDEATGGCECADPGCPAHDGKESCDSKGSLTVYRVDMEDQTGTKMCDACAEDALSSGLFTTKDDEDGEDENGYDMKAALKDAQNYYSKLKVSPDKEDLASAMADFLGNDSQEDYNTLYDAAIKFLGGKNDDDTTDGEDDEVEIPAPKASDDEEGGIPAWENRTEAIMHGDEMATVRVGQGREFMRVQIVLDEHDVRNLDVKNGYEERAKSILEGHNVNPVKPTFLRRFNAMVLNRDLLNVAKEA